MKAVQIDRYSKEIRTVLREIPVPEIGPTEVLVEVRAAAVNPLELLILSGSVRLIQDYPMPLTLGNECSGVVKAVGEAVTGFRAGDKVYTRLPLSRIGAFAEYVAVEQAALSPMPAGYDFSDAAAIPLTGLTAWQGLTEELEVQRGKTLLIPGGSGSFGQMAVPLAKALGLHVIVTGNARARASIMAAGAGYDRAARKQGKEYRFLFVRADGAQLREVTRIVEQNHILPRTDPRTFTLETAREALELVKNGPTDGKVLLRL